MEKVQGLDLLDLAQDLFVRASLSSSGIEFERLYSRYIRICKRVPGLQEYIESGKHAIFTLLLSGRVSLDTQTRDSDV
jgi:hypothetical protein